MNVFVRKQPYKGPVRAVVLDWAGTAVDFGCVGPVAVFMEVFRRRKVEVTIEEARVPMGLMKKDHIRAMCQMESVAFRWRDAHGRMPDEKDAEAMFGEMEQLILLHGEVFRSHSGLAQSCEGLPRKGYKDRV